jgi:hypothetical protein
MTLDEFIHLASQTTITRSLMDEFAKAHNQTVAQALDLVAKRIIQQYNLGHWQYDYCDAVANSLYQVILFEYDEIQSNLAWEMFLAFDEGEWHHNGDPEDQSPEDLYTRPAIRELIQKIQ